MVHFHGGHYRAKSPKPHHDRIGTPEYTKGTDPSTHQNISRITRHCLSRHPHIQRNGVVCPDENRGCHFCSYPHVVCFYHCTYKWVSHVDLYVQSNGQRNPEYHLQVPEE